MPEVELVTIQVWVTIPEADKDDVLERLQEAAGTKAGSYFVFDVQPADEDEAGEWADSCGEGD